eukprot:5632160-Pyramimonas_sp.AAC.1
MNQSILECPVGKARCLAGDLAGREVSGVHRCELASTAQARRSGAHTWSFPGDPWRRRTGGTPRGGRPAPPAPTPGRSAPG